MERVPEHIAVIMDGNGRWASDRGLPRSEGHYRGVESLKKLIQALPDYGVSCLTVFAFSTENWARPEWEIRTLLVYFHQFLEQNLLEMHEKGIAIRFIGETEPLDEMTLDAMQRAERLTQFNRLLHLTIAFNYGGRQEIVQAVRKMLDSGSCENGALSAKSLAEYLYTSGLPDPDLIIRTAGEQRLSNFLIWQSAYAEFLTVPVCWPEFDEQCLQAALLEYQRRTRTYGSLERSTV